MKKIFLNIILPLLLLAAMPVSAQDSSAAQDNTPSSDAAPAEGNVSALADDLAADEAYMQGTEEGYLRAIELYKKAIDKSGTSAAIYYNLGNAYYRADSLAKAIICYERALRLDPTDEDIRANLEFVNSKIIDAQATDGISNVIVDKSLQMFSANGWAVLSVIIFAVVLLLAAGYIFSSNVKLRKVYFFAGLGVLLINVLCVIITVNATSVASSAEDAIVIVPATQLSTSPATPLNESQKAMLLHEGSKVRVIRELATPNDPQVKKWTEVEVAGDHRAWIDASAIEII